MKVRIFLASYYLLAGATLWHFSGSMQFWLLSTVAIGYVALGLIGIMATLNLASFRTTTPLNKHLGRSLLAIVILVPAILIGGILQSIHSSKAEPLFTNHDLYGVTICKVVSWNEYKTSVMALGKIDPKHPPVLFFDLEKPSKRGPRLVVVSASDYDLLTRAKARQKDILRRPAFNNL